MPRGLAGGELRDMSSAFSAVAGQRSFLCMWSRFWSVAHLCL